MLYYLIKDLRVNSYLTDKEGRKIRCTTIRDCLDYLEYVLKEDDYEYYYFELIF